MPWDWVTSTVTGGVGLAGIAATSLTAFTQQRNQLKILRLQQSHQKDDAVKAAAKQAYLKFMDVISEIATSVDDERWSTQIEAKKFSSEIQRKLTSTYDELEIAVPAWIGTYAGRVIYCASNWMTAEEGPCRSANDSHKDFLFAITKLKIAMGAYMRNEEDIQANHREL